MLAPPIMYVESGHPNDPRCPKTPATPRQLPAPTAEAVIILVVCQGKPTFTLGVLADDIANAHDLTARRLKVNTDTFSLQCAGRPARAHDVADGATLTAQFFSAGLRGGVASPDAGTASAPQTSQLSNDEYHAEAVLDHGL